MKHGTICYDELKQAYFKSPFISEARLRYITKHVSLEARSYEAVSFAEAVHSGKSRGPVGMGSHKSSEN